MPLDGNTGYWATEQDTGQGGYAQELENVSWTHDEASDAWVARHLRGGWRLVKRSRKGNGKNNQDWKRSTGSFQL